MSKRTFIWFGVLILVLAVVIPFAAFRAKGDGENGETRYRRTSRAPSRSSSSTAAPATRSTAPAPTATTRLTSTNCSPPRAEIAESTIKSTEGRVLNAIENGVDSSTTPGRMPGGILNEEQAQQVAEFVARTAGEG